jgi:ribosomal protein S18 acetylase RimI-like enzyme
MSPILYRTTTESELDQIQALWEQLRSHHEKNSRYFKHRYAQMTWEGRKASLLEKVARGDLMRIVIAEDDDDSSLVGYCIVSLSVTEDPVLIETKSVEGEIDSILVAAGRRQEGIGDALMKIALEWLDANNATSKKVVVADGNESAWGFYERFGFYPKFHTLEQIQD